jgi:MoaA/NifB/PqqE/SkfB family radical SAM enzyme
VLSGGEPLMHSDVAGVCRFFRERQIRITVLSTGLLLERYAEKLAATVDDIIVSLDGPPDVHDQIRRVPGAFARLAAGVRAIHGIRPEFPVAARCTVQRLNCRHLRAATCAAQSLGLRSISFLAADTASTAFNHPNGWAEPEQNAVRLSREDLAALAEEMEALISEWRGTGFVLESPAKLRRIVSHLSVPLGLAEAAAPSCNAPWVSAVIETDGTVRPCFFHPPIGKIGTQSLFDVLNGPQAVSFRQNLDVATNPVCRQCVCSLNWSRS